jgi:hypothetical protein
MTRVRCSAKVALSLLVFVMAGAIGCTQLKSLGPEDLDAGGTGTPSNAGGRGGAGAVDASQIGGANGGAGGGNCLADEHMCAGECFKNNDPRSCGACNHDCTSLANVKPGSVQCRAGKCLAPAEGCVAGHGHCTANPDDICETDLSAIANCGTCGNNCPPTAPLCSSVGATQACVLNCSGTTADKCGTTCLDLKTDLANCGACGQACSIPNGEAACVNGACAISQCKAGFGDCSSTEPGCETMLNMDANCGSCGNACLANFRCNASTHTCVDICTLGSAGTPGHCCNSSVCLNSLECVSGVCKTTCATDPDCQPGNACSSGRCLPSGSFCDQTHPCAAGLNCTGGRCAPCGGSGQACCTSGSACHTNFTCGAGSTCQCGGIGQACCNGTACTDDGNRCNGPEVCQGTCQHGTPVDCNASDTCHNVGVCNPATGGCTNPNNTGRTCNDNNSCTQSDTCQNGVCRGTAVTCASGQRCVSGSCTCDTTSCSTGCCLNNQCSQKITCYQDADGDGYGNPAVSSSVCSASCPGASVSNNKDCCDIAGDFTAASMHPGADFHTSPANDCNIAWDWDCSGTIEESQLNFNAAACESAQQNASGQCPDNATFYTMRFGVFDDGCGQPQVVGACACGPDIFQPGLCHGSCSAGGPIPMLGCK